MATGYSRSGNSLLNNRNNSPDHYSSTNTKVKNHDENFHLILFEI